MRLAVVSGPGLALAAILYVALNTLVDVATPDVRVDLTEEGLFTLSDGTHATLARIIEPIELHFFFSERLGREVPFYASYARRVREMLAEIAAASEARVRVREHRPEPFSPTEDRAVGFGIQGIPVEQDGELAYFGLVGVNSVDEVERIAFFRPERENLLEYDLVKLIDALSNPEPTVVGVMSALPLLGDIRAAMQGAVSPAWEIAGPLQQAFELVNLPETLDELPARIDVLLVAHPLRVNARTMYEIEQFLFRGGRALLLLDPRCEAAPLSRPRGNSSSATTLTPLLDRWGIAVSEGELLGDRSLAVRVNAGTTQQAVPSEYVVWLGITAEHLSQADPVTSRLALINFASAGFITRREDSPLAMEPLITSTVNSAPVPVDAVRGLRPDVQALAQRFRPDEHTYTLAARLSGPLETAFPDGAPDRLVPLSPAELAARPERAQLLRSGSPVNLIVVADADLLDERFWLRKQSFFGREVAEPIAANADFIVNALANLAGSGDLIGLRSRGVSQRPFVRVQNLRRAAEAALADKEQALREKLTETRRKIAALEGVETVPDAKPGEPSVSVNLSDDQRAEIDGLRQEMLAIRSDLREVKRGLREDVEHLEGWLQRINIGLAPLIVAALALVLALARVARRRRAYRAG